MDLAETGGAPSVPSTGRGLPGRVRSLSSPPPPGRLTSLRTRDLTLGGAFKKNKKVFEPNVHAVRKSKDELKQELCVTSKKDRRERDERRRESRGRRRERPQTIQSHSIFEQGPADTGRKTGWRGARDVHDSSTSPICKLVKKERKEPEEEEEDEDEILNRLQRDDFIDDPGLRNDERLKPIQLPLRQCSSFTQTQPAGAAAPAAGGGGGGEGGADSSRTEQQPPLVQLLHELSLAEKEELFFMQLPDCMPGRVPPLKGRPASQAQTDKPAEKAAKVENHRTAHLQAQDPAVKDSCPLLSQVPGGFLGKLQIRRSGKVDLKLGDIVLNVSEGAAFSFLQQLVSVRLSEGRTGDMMVLGNVHHKLVLSPDFQALLQQAGAEQSQS